MLTVLSPGYASWISIEDRLPNNGQTVDIWNGTRETDLTYDPEGKIDSGTKTVIGHGPWVQFAGNTVYRLVKPVTYWMPIPQEPTP